MAGTRVCAIVDCLTILFNTKTISYFFLSSVQSVDHIILKIKSARILSQINNKIQISSKCSFSVSLLPSHIPVMKTEILNHILLKPNQVFLDMTFGTGGHTNAVLQTVSNNLKCFCLDRDPESLPYMEKIKIIHENSGHQVIPIIGQFSDLPSLAQEKNLKSESVDFILMDLGVSSMQLDNALRGFGIRHDTELDMRMNQKSDNTPTAADVLNTLDFKDLRQLFRIYGEEKFANRIANAIIDYREAVGQFVSTKQLVDLIECIIPRSEVGSNSIHPATRVFQALRIFVNDELNELCIGLEIAEYLLKPDTGVLAVLSFHSLEDRLVKWTFKSTSEDLINRRLSEYLCDKTSVKYDSSKARDRVLSQLVCTSQENNTDSTFPRWKSLVGPLIPSDFEVAKNPRCRSAKLRIGTKSCR